MKRYAIPVGMRVRKFPEIGNFLRNSKISYGIFPEISGKKAVLFRKNSAEKFLKFVAYNFMKHRKKSQYFDSSHTVIHKLMVANLQLAFAYLMQSPLASRRLSALAKNSEGSRQHDTEQETFRNFSGKIPQFCFSGKVTTLHTGTSTGWDWSGYYFLAGTGMVIYFHTSTSFLPIRALTSVFTHEFRAQSSHRRNRSTDVVM